MMRIRTAGIKEWNNSECNKNFFFHETPEQTQTLTNARHPSQRTQRGAACLEVGIIRVHVRTPSPPGVSFRFCRYNIPTLFLFNCHSKIL